MDFLLRTKGKKFLTIGDLLSYMYLTLGIFVMFASVLWAVMSSFKTPAAISRYPPEALPYASEKIEVEGYDRPLSLYEVINEDGTVSQLAQVRSIGIEAQLVDPANPEDIIKIPISETDPVRSLQFELNNYIEPLETFKFSLSSKIVSLSQLQPRCLP
jgi:alpha-1,4-digalacturonate transport system permease protein